MSDTVDPGPDQFVNAIRDRGERSAQDAVSPKGALGQMQVMPATAQAPGFGVAPVQDFSSNSLTAMGEAYARAMLRRYSGNQVLASAAYNAGPGRVDQWITQFGDPRSGAISTSDWAKKIPFSETQGYVGRVAGTGSGSGLGQGLSGSAPAIDMGMLGNSMLPQGTAPQAQAAPTPPVDPSSQVAMSLLRTLLPSTHTFVPVDYDPWAVQPKVGKAKGAT